MKQDPLRVKDTAVGRMERKAPLREVKCINPLSLLRKKKALFTTRATREIQDFIEDWKGPSGPAAVQQ